MKNKNIKGIIHTIKVKIIMSIPTTFRLAMLEAIVEMTGKKNQVRYFHSLLHRVKPDIALKSNESVSYPKNAHKILHLKKKSSSKCVILNLLKLV